MFAWLCSVLFSVLFAANCDGEVVFCGNNVAWTSRQADFSHENTDCSMIVVSSHVMTMRRYYRPVGGLMQPAEAAAIKLLQGA
jgi:hypothetical protein